MLEDAFLVSPTQAREMKNDGSRIHIQEAEKRKKNYAQMQLNWDELCQILLFLPGSDVCHFSQINSIAHEGIRSDQHLWMLLIKRDFPWEVGQVQLYQVEHGTLTKSRALTTTKTGSRSCDEMKEYACYYRHFCPFPFRRGAVKSVDEHSKDDDPKIFNVLFGLVDNRLNRAVTSVLLNRKLVLSRESSEVKSTSFQSQGIYSSDRLFLQSAQPEMTPNLSVKLWMTFQMKGLTSDIHAFHNYASCLVIPVDARHAWYEDTYSTHQDPHSNSLRKAIVTLKETKLLINHVLPSRNCKGVLIVGVGAWQQDAPITKQRFLNDCSEVFCTLPYVMPLEYFELTCENAEVMSDVLLRRFYTFYQRSVLEDGPVKKVQQPQEQQQREEVVTGWGCIMS